MKYKMPLLKYSNQFIPQTDWSNTLVIACQHIVESVFLYFQKTIDQGLPSNNVYLLGKSYSTSDEVLEAFVSLGVNVHPASNQFDSHAPFAQQFDQAIESFFATITQQCDLSQYDKVVIVDDGGELIGYANQHFSDLSNFAGLEQTSSGYYKLKSLELKFPVINVARSQAKLLLESPFIAEAVLENFHRNLMQYQLKPKSVLIVGSGYISQCIDEQLSYRYDVQRYDIDGIKSEFSHTELDNSLAQFDVIISCAGTTVFTKQDYPHFKDGVILASAGSSDIEFSAVELRRQLAATTDVHADIQVQGPNGLIHLFNAGFPLNFDGSWQLIPLDKIQLSVSLLYCALHMARHAQSQNALLCFDNQVQQKLISEFQRMMTAN